MRILSRLKTALIRGKFALNTDVLNTVLHRSGSFVVDYCQSMVEIGLLDAFPRCIFIYYFCQGDVDE